MNSTENKICKKCGIEKPIDDFYKRLKSIDGHRHECKQCLIKSVHDRRVEDLENKKIKEREWYANNKHKKRDYISQKKKNDLNFKLRNNLGNRIQRAIKLQYSEKAFGTIELLGCNIETARKHIENQFTDGMSWEKFGKNGIHIDHIIPCASFDLTNPEEQKKCFHYTNLQPLWAKDNLSKGSKII